MPLKERSFQETHFATRKLYEESIAEQKMGGRVLESPNAQRHLSEGRRSYDEAFYQYPPYRGSHQQQRLLGYGMKNGHENEAKNSQIDSENTKNNNDKETEIEVDVVHADETEDKEVRDDDGKSRFVRLEAESDKKREVDDKTKPSDEGGNKTEMYNRDYRNNISHKYDSMQESKKAKEIDEQRRKRDEFIRSKCGEVLSVMFPEFDGTLIKKIAERSDYDIQKSVEQLLEIKKQMRANEAKSAFLFYNERASPERGRVSCQCCAVRGVPTTDVKPRYYEVRKRDWVEASGRDGRIYDRPDMKRAHMEV